MGEAIINTAIAALRKDPGKRGELADEDFYGRKVEILKQVEGGFSYIKTQYGYCGYTERQNLITEEKKIRAWEEAFKKLVVVPFADILDIPSVRGGNIITLCKGALLTVLSAADSQGYVKVGLSNGETGYTKEGFLKEYKADYSMEKEEELRYDIIQTAYSYMGCQYRWGGKSPLGVDCSGLTFMAYQMNGITIYRDASIIEGYPVKPIQREQKKPGDLLFFGGHVAIYLGEEKYIHSTARNGSDGVAINSLDPQNLLYREDLAKRLKEVGSIFYR
ncbi:C40 family peptidase [Anaerocolumna xylanovorans]|uniref:NlpC/P60 family protein n=1 Tax=Anaerocolumna xylanovorans DSM 12503 TaxID=1121345 RepID=A0A1M7YFM8_9FIRM|nr:SH3 domain-containing C40 family peptidase [Anaerocolumna xylanovorans]SHO51444.1 NlpC/P60 family protein [Anaerocolumna xylanovorans DSM 12503]